MHHGNNPEDTTPVTSMDTRKDASTNNFGKEITTIIYRDDSSHGNWHNDDPNVDLDDLIGYIFVKEHNGIPQRAIVKQKFYSEGNFLIKFMNGGEDLMAYNDIINIYNAIFDYVKKLCNYGKTSNHRKALRVNNGVHIMWDTSETKCKYMQTLKGDDNINLAAYTKKLELVDNPGWKWARILTKNTNKLNITVKIYALRPN